MKHFAMIAAFISAFSFQLSAFSSPNAITNWLPGYVCVTQNWATAAEAGLDTNEVYACIPLSALPNATAAQIGADGTGDVRRLIFTFNEGVYTNWSMAASTNRPANATFYRSETLSDRVYIIRHQFDTTWGFTPTLYLED